MNITGTTKLYGLFGSPVGHSMSPAMYNYCFKKWGLDCRYLAFDILKERTGDAVGAIRVLGLAGVNLTMPCKQAVIPYLDWISPAVRLAGACNTIVVENGRLNGYMTDGEGYVMDLKAQGMDVSGKKITLLGAGGAATAIQVQVLLDGARELSVFNRRDGFWDSAEQAVERLQNAFPDRKIALYDLDDTARLGEEILDSDVLTNATPAGMKPLDQLNPIRDPSFLRPGLLVTDCVYNPRRTKLSAQAQMRGCRTADGLGMLIYQGAAAFKLYTGRDMPVKEIKSKFF